MLHPPFAGFPVHHFRRKNAFPRGVKADDIPTHFHHAAVPLHVLRHVFPKLAGTEFRIHELLDQRSFGALLSNVTGGLFLQKVQNRLRDGKAFDALRAPLGADFVAGYAPHLFRVRLKESEVKFAPETVDQELFQGLFRLDLAGHRGHVADADFDGAGQAEVGQRLRREADRVVEEPPQEIDS